jgi:holo-ACP synthase/triphosphoribosyl-dephospho-CoA synthase
MNKMIYDAARLACQALLYEVCTTPKPGLVDRENCGSHRDMDIFTFMNSASALWPYFAKCTQIGRETAKAPAAETFCRLRSEGVKAESDMFAATNGVNTHKGAIFSMGIVCAALGRLPEERWKYADVILQECADMTQGLVETDFSGLTKERAVTVGQKLYLNYGITGVRGQMEAGLPAVREVGLPVLKEGILRGLGINDSGCAALLALMASATDTNLIARSDLVTQQATVDRIKELLCINPYPNRQTLEQLDREFIEKNLSPGGSADLLAICYFLYFLETRNSHQ